MLTRC